jgi:hypothetical protein
MIALYRQYILTSPEGITSMQKDAWHNTVLEKVKSAASNTSSILNQLISKNMVKFCQAML